MSEPSDSVSDKSIPKRNTHANTRAEKQPYKGNRGAKYSYRGRGGNRGKPDNADRNGRADSTDKFDKTNRGGRGSRSRGGRGGKASEATEWRPKKSEGSYQKKAEGSHQKRAEGSRYKKAEGSHQKREEGSHNKKAEGPYRKRAEESNQKNRKKNKKARKPASFYTPYITKEEFEQGLKEEKYIVGPLSVWRLPYRTFVQLEGCRDIMVTGYKNINRAMHGDIVAVEIIPKPESEKKHEKARKEANEESEEELSEEYTEESEADLSIEEDTEEEEEEEEEQEERRYGKVVYIVERNRATTFLGIVEGNLFKPLSDKFPWMQMKELKGKSIKYDEQFVTVAMRTWKEGFMRPSCIVKSVEGNIDKFETQYAALKIKNNINHAEDFDEKLLEGLPLSGWTIPQEEIANRRDLRKELIFSIDPPTAKDLDDALSCVRLPNGNFQVGVHIADVSYFVTENSPLDLEARDRATSVYFVTENVPMLPRILCDELCSLQGGVDRLAFSVIWELTPEGKKVSEKFTKSIICTAGQLDYATAQHMIKHPDEFEGTDYEACSVAVGYLNSIAKNISASRYENGSISLDSAEIHFDFDDEDNIIGVHPYERYDSHFLVEEFMLLANIAVAEKLHSSMREGALLRWHPSPDAEKLKLFAKQCESLGLKVDCSNSQTLHESIQAIAKDYNGITMEAILYLASQPMQSALYCATAVDAQENAYHHYALNFPLYTHFTSPIRRYADLIVHRQLSKILNNERQTMSADVVQKICTTCNQRKRDADYASRDCTRLYLNKYLRTRRFIESGIVVDVTKDSTTVLVPDYDIRCQIYFDKEDYKLQYKKSTAELVVTFLEDEDELPEKDLPKVSLKLLKVVDVELLYTSQNYCQTIGLKLAKPGERALLKSNLEK